MEILTFNCMLNLMLAASDLMDDFSIHILIYIFGGCIGSFVVD